jgi:uncharacterized protein YecT (DUF1311 family)
MRRWSLLGFLMLGGAAMGLCSSAWADDCTNAQDQATMNQCADRAYRKQDAELNALYQQIKARLKDNADADKLLVAAQKAWIGFRDANCRFSASGVSGGSAYPMIYAACLADMTKARIKDFQANLKCEEGDLSCPVPAAH